ncbi:MAG: YopX family protein [Schleiferiaceae bacterium]|jgi:hypothetical protein|nr:YopX family protein [Schleiferiaceae bacterium]
MSLSSFLDPKEKRYRLRNGDKLLGYAREVYGGARFYSKDGFWWTGREIIYTEVDEWVGLVDKNRKHIYEWDIVYYKAEDETEYKSGAILWQDKQKRFGIRDLDEDVFFPLRMEGFSLFNPNELEVYSQLYLNPDLLDEWGL